MGMSRSSFRYTRKTKDDIKLRSRLRELAQERRRWGCPTLHELLKREGLVVNHKRTERIYREEGLSIRRRKRKKLTHALRLALPPVERINQQWAMDFMSDSFASGRRFRCFNLIDCFTRECLVIEVSTSIGGKRVAEILDRVIDFRGKPETILSDNGPEFISGAMNEWAYNNNIDHAFIRPGKPTENAYVESFNGKFREQCLDDNWFLDLEHARKIIENWRQDYNKVRPHRSLGKLTPEEFAEKHGLTG